MVDAERMLSDAELAILSLLAERPMHGYQIEQVIEERGMREWIEMGFSSIYYLLNKLKQAGLLSSRLEKSEGRGPARQVFSLTSSGRKAWKAAALEAIANPSRMFSNFQLGLSNILALDPVKVKDALQRYRDSLADRREQIRAKLDGSGPGAPFEAAALFDLSLIQITCELEWVEKFIGQFDLHQSKKQDAKKEWIPPA